MKDQVFEPLNRSGRTAYFDHLKVFEYFLLMIVHTASYQWYQTDIFSSDWLVLNFYKSATRPCVLVFFMISGALLLGRDIPLKKLYKNNILKLAAAFIFWDIVYAVITYWNDGLPGIVFKMFNSNYHLWYLLAMIGIYICFPLIKLISDNRKVMTYFLVISAIFAFLLPTVFTLCEAFGSSSLVKLSEIIQGHVYNMHVYSVLGYPFFFVAGYYIHTTDLSAIIRRSIYGLGILSILSGAFINAAHVRMIGAPDDTFNNGFMLYEMISAIAVFTFFKYNVSGNTVSEKICYKISAWGLGIYMIHDLVIMGIDHILGLNGMSFNPIIAVPVTALIAFVISAVISAALNLIPGVRKYLV